MSMEKTLLLLHPGFRAILGVLWRTNDDAHQFDSYIIWEIMRNNWEDS
jgi:hypothetical protein